MSVPQYFLSNRTPFIRDMCEKLGDNCVIVVWEGAIFLIIFGYDYRLVYYIVSMEICASCG